MLRSNSRGALRGLLLGAVLAALGSVALAQTPGPKQVLACSDLNNSGTGCTANAGTGASNYAAGNDSRIVGAAQQAATSTSFTPSDASGATLTLTVNTATFSTIGNQDFVIESVTYPSTANGANAALGNLPDTNASATNVGCSVAVSTAATQYTAGVNNASKNVLFFAAKSSTQVTNTQMSTSTVELQCTYPKS